MGAYRAAVSAACLVRSARRASAPTHGMTGSECSRTTTCWAWGETTSRSTAHIRTAHHSFVLCFAELGLVGCFLCGSLIVPSFQALNRVIQCMNPGDDHGRYAVLLWVSMMGFMVYAWFLSRTFVPTFCILMGVVVGLLYMALQAHPAALLVSLAGQRSRSSKRSNPPSLMATMACSRTLGLA